MALKAGSKDSKDLREKIKNELQSYSEDLSFNMLKKSIVTKLNSLHTFPLPETLVSREEDVLKNEIEKNSNLKKKPSSESIKKEAEDKVKIGLIISEIGIKSFSPSELVLVAISPSFSNLSSIFESVFSTENPTETLPQ